MTSLGFDNKLICAALSPLSPSSLSPSVCATFRCLSSVLFMNMQLVCKLKCYVALVLLYLLLTLNDFKYEYSISMFVAAAFARLFWLAQSQPFSSRPSCSPYQRLKVGYGIAVEMPESQRRHELVMFHGVMSQAFPMKCSS